MHTLTVTTEHDNCPPCDSIVPGVTVRAMDQNETVIGETDGILGFGYHAARAELTRSDDEGLYAGVPKPVTETRSYPIAYYDDINYLEDAAYDAGITIQLHVAPYSGEGDYDATAPASVLDAWEDANGYS